MAEDIIYKGVVYKWINISKSTEEIKSRSKEDICSKLKNNECVENSKEIANILGAKCVEGFVVCTVRKGVDVDNMVIRHCWNKIEDNYFDFSKECKWTEFEFDNEILDYYVVEEFEYTKYPKGSKNYFLSNAVEIASEMNALFQQDMKSESDGTIDLN